MNIRIAALTAALALTTGSASAQTVTYDYDKEAAFPRFQTYAWVAGTTLADQLNHQRIVAAIDAQLAAKGLLKVSAPGEGTDLLVAYHANFDRNARVTAYSSGWGRFSVAGHRIGTANVEEIVQGTLIVDLVDARRRSIVWRGIATKDVDVQADPARRDRNINRAAEKLFRHYPPGK